MSTKREPKLYAVHLTKAELTALFDTAGQMRDDLNYYDFMGPKRSENFANAYDRAMAKLRKHL